MVLENYSVQNSHSRYFGSPMPYDSNALNGYTFKVTYITNIIVVYCLNAYQLFHSFKYVKKQTACQLIIIRYNLVFAK